MTDKDLAGAFGTMLAKARLEGISGDNMCGAVSALAKMVFSSEGFSPQDVVDVWRRSGWPSQKDAQEMMRQNDEWGGRE